MCPNSERWRKTTHLKSQQNSISHSVRLSQRWCSAATKPAIERPTAQAVCLVALRAKSVALWSSLAASGVRPPHSTISLRTSARYAWMMTIVWRMPSYMVWLEGGGRTFMKAPKMARGERLACPRSQEWQYCPAPQNPLGWWSQRLPC